jgi:hypothetical protein
MAKCDLHIVFDDEDRTYKIGETVSGKIQILAHDELQCRKITLIRAWKTRGRGNQASGGEEEMVFAEGEKFFAGEVKEFPFLFSSLHGPVSYQGDLLNVEWHLRGQVDISRAADVVAEEKFLLVPGQPSENVILGSAIPSNDSPEKTSSFRERLLKAQALAAPFLIIGVLMIFASGANLVAILIGMAVAGFGAWQLFILWRNKLAQRKLGRIEVRLAPAKVRTGNLVECKFLFHAQDAQRLKRIVATLKGEERVASGSGGLKNTHTHTIYETAFERSKESAFAVADKIQIILPVQIPPNAPSTFYAPDNALNWSIHVQIEVPGWPDWVQAFPITVLP